MIEGSFWFGYTVPGAKGFWRTEVSCEKSPVFIRAVGTRYCTGTDWGKAETFVGREEEGAVVSVVEVGQNDRTADGAAEVIRDLLWLVGGVGAIGNGIEGAVLEVPKGGAVQAVCAGFGYSRDLARLRVLRVVIHAIDADLSDGFGRGEGIGLDVVRGLVLRGDAVDRGLGLRGQTALNGELDARVR